MEKHAYEEAVSLLEQINAALVENKEEKLRMIRTAYAHDLFLHGEYDTSLGLFQELDTPAANVIELYPSMISGRLAKEQEHLEGETNDDDSLMATAASPRKNGNGASDENQEYLRPDSRTSNYSKANTILSNHSSSRLSAVLHQHQAHQQKELVPLTGIHLHDAITYLIRFLTDKRQKLSKQMATSHIMSPTTNGASINGMNTTASSSSASSLAPSSSSAITTMTNVTPQDILEQATLVDTTLLKSYMLTNDALVGPLLRVQNHCDVEECEAILMEKKKYKELVDLYNCKELHSNALDLLSK